MSRLEPVGISAWSYVNATGMAHFAASQRTEIPQPAGFERGGLVPHPAWLGLAGNWGRVSVEVAALPAPLRFQRSRSTELLVHTLAPIQEQLRLACERYGAERVGIVLGSSTGGIDATEHAVRVLAQTGQMPSEFVFEEAHVFSALVRVAQASCGARGPAYVVSTACSSSGKALGAAQRLILSGACDAVLTGGVDSLSELTLRGFAGLSILSPTTCKPFDGARDGISLGEGASLLLLERDSTSQYVLTGVGEAGDAYHPTAPHPEGLGAELAMRACLELSGIDAEQVDYVNAHGTGTLQNDQVEAMVIDRVLGAKVPFSSTKDRTGHQLGTAGATEAIISLMALMQAALPRNRLPDVVDGALRRQPLTRQWGKGSERAPVLALSNSFAFGGSNVTVGLAKRKLAEGASSRPRERYHVLRAVSWGMETDTDLSCSVLPLRARGRASPLTRIFSELFGRLLTDVPSPRFPMFFGSAYGEMANTIALLDQMLAQPTVSPAKFQASVHNTAAGLLSLVTENRSPATAIAAGDDTVAMTLCDACSWLDCHGGQAIALVADEVGPERLLRRRPFPAAGVGFLLSDRVENGVLPLGSIARPQRTANLRASDSGALENPAHHGLELASFLTGEAPGTGRSIPLGPGWHLVAERVHPRADGSS
jgi:3-oxoacyl-[acyl-carrier-protein] synthase-1